MSIQYADDKMVRGSEIHEIYEEVGWSLLGARDPREIEAAVRNSTVFITARDGARLIAYVGALSDRSYYAHVTELVVRPPSRGKGVGSELVRRTLDAVSPARAVTMFAEPDAVEFYRRFGFAATAGGLLYRRP